MTYQGWYKPSRFPTKFPSKRDRIKTYNHTINAVLTTTIQQESNISKLSDINSFFWRVSGWFSTARTSGEQRLGACCSWLLQAWRLSGGISWPSTREKCKNLHRKSPVELNEQLIMVSRALRLGFWDVFEVVMTCPRASPTASPCFSIVKELGFLQHKCLKINGLGQSLSTSWNDPSTEYSTDFRLRFHWGHLASPKAALIATWPILVLRQNHWPFSFSTIYQQQQVSLELGEVAIGWIGPVE